MLISGNTLRQLRQLKGIKQETVAKGLDISQPAYSAIEQSEYVDVEKFEQILSILGYTASEFKEIIGHIPPPKMT